MAALISTQTLTLKSPPPLLSHPPLSPSPQSLSLSILNPTPRFIARRRVVPRATATPAVDFGPEIGNTLADVSIYTAAGDSVQFKDLWDQNEGVAVVALLRHFGCPCCWELASALKESKERFDSAGVKLISVGVGSPDKARLLAERLPFPMDSLYADTDRKAYDVLGLYYGVGRTFFNPASAKVLSRFDALRKAVKNYTIEATPDDRSSVLQQGVAVVALLRHFGCFCSWELALTLKESKEKFDAAGVKLIAVGVGTPDRARVLATQLPFPMDCLYADPDRKAYDTLGLYYGWGRTFFYPSSIAKIFSRFDSVRKAFTNYTIKATPDDKSGVLQQGGMFVFKGKELLYARKDKSTSDHAPLDDVLNVCCKIPVA